MDLALVTSAGIFILVLTALGLIVGLNEQMSEEREYLLSTRIGGRPRPQVLRSSQLRASARWGAFGAWLDQWRRRADVHWTVEQLMVSSIVLATLSGLVVSQFGPLAMVPSALGGASVPMFVLQRRAATRTQRMSAQLPAALEMLITYLRGGSTLDDALAETARETPAPLGDALRRTSDLIELGVPLADAFGEVSNRNPDLHALHFVFGVIEIQQRTGGNLIAMLSRARDAQREAIAMQERLQAASQEVRTTSRVLGFLPLMLGLGLTAFAPDYARTLLEHDIGRVALMGSALWMLVGIGAMERLQMRGEG